MTLLEIFLIGIGLSMDAFAVAICKGLAMPNKVDKKGALLIALYFGVFQAVMPTLGLAVGFTVCTVCDAACPLDRVCPAGLDRRKHDPGELVQGGKGGRRDGLGQP